MAVDITSIAVQAVVKHAVGRISAAMGRSTSREARAVDEESIQDALNRHLIEAVNWSSRVEIFGLSEDTDEATIAIPIAGEPRRFRMAGRSSSFLSEDNLLSDARNFLLLGDPGAGKTTTIKRLIRKMILTDATAATDIYDYPLLLRLKDIPAKPIPAVLADILAIPYQMHRIPQPEAAGVTQRIEYRCGNIPLEHVVPMILNATRAVILMDGLDEVPPDTRGERQDEIVALGLRLDSAKAIVSCRTGDFNSLFGNFAAVEVSGLTSEQVRAIVGRQIERPEEFLDHLEKLPYKDVADRPLLLTQLLLLYRRDGYLPQQPAQVYEGLVELLLERWDRVRRIRRATRYAGFEPKQKAAFLAALAYHLTFAAKAKSFSTSLLEHAYLAIHERFHLPADEVSEVVAEIQTHTGVVTQARDDVFEFSHLSLQEYLCAWYMIREPLGEHLRTYMRDYPEPVAVAVALAAEPSRWFSTLVLENARSAGRDSMRSFVGRVLLEKPYFSTLYSLGIAVMKLFLDFREDSATQRLLTALTEQPYVKESIAAAFSYYPGPRADAWGVTFEATLPMRDDRGIMLPSRIGLPAAVYHAVLTRQRGK